MFYVECRDYLYNNHSKLKVFHNTEFKWIFRIQDFTYLTGLQLAKGLILRHGNLSKQKETLYREDWEFTQVKGI